MSKDAKNLLAPPDAKDSPTKARKMTQAILQDAEQEKEAYEFLEDDDDFEEFEIDEVDYSAMAKKGSDVDMSDANAKGAEDYDRKLWQVDWDDEEGEVAGDFIAQLRAEIKK